MSGLSIGLATFNSCNKAGSIPFFTQHLSRYPSDYWALTWRARAYSIIGKKAEAKADFHEAYRVCSGSQKLLAQALSERIDGNVEQGATILRNTTRQYPNCSEAWHELGEHAYCVQKNADISLQYEEKAKRLAMANSQTGEPWYPWCNKTIGDIYFEKRRVNDARKSYEAAVESSDTFTVGHLGLSRCDILNDNIERAKKSFSTAKSLNPELVKCETFDDFRRQVKAEQAIDSLNSELIKLNMFFDLLTQTSQDESENSQQQQTEEEPDEASGFQYLSDAVGSLSAYQSVRSGEQRGYQIGNSGPSLQNFGFLSASNSSRSYFGGYHGGSFGGFGGSAGAGGNGGSGDGSSSDDESLTPEQRERAWEKIVQEAPAAKEFKGKRFYQSKCKNYWYSKIKPNERHGREVKSFLKRYVDRGRAIELDVSIDENMQPMTGKHESGKIEIIKKSDMNGIHIAKKK